MSSYDDLSRRWTPRPTATTSLRLMALVAPFALGAAAAVITSRLVGPPDTAGLAALRVAAIATIATAVVLLTDLGARRIRVLASLLHLGLAFPGPAPSRFRLALTAPSRRRIPARMADLVESGLDPEPERAAHQVVELLGGFGEHDHRTRGHAERARLLSDLVAEELGVDDDGRARLQWAALLHDIGNSSIPSEVLDKQRKLSPSEWRALRAHPETGDRMIRPLKRWLGDSADVVVAHHERWDGDGYPRGLGSGKISRSAGIVAVTDAFEAMTAPRRYRAPVGVDDARAEIEACAGTQFDPRVVEAFLCVPTRELRSAIGSFVGVASVRPISALISTTGSSTRARAAVAGVALTALAIGVGGGVLDAVERGPLAFSDRGGPLAELDLPPGATTAPTTSDPASVTTTTTAATSTTTSTPTTTTPVVSTTSPGPGPFVPGVPTTVTSAPGPGPLPTTTTTATTAPPISTAPPPTAPPSTPASTTTTSTTTTTTVTTTTAVVPPILLPVRATVTCASANGSGGVVARFGYANPNAVNVGVGVGPANLVSPGPANQGQPTLFAPGVETNAFTIDSGLSPVISWTLQGSLATASAASPAC